MVVEAFAGAGGGGDKGCAKGGVGGGVEKEAVEWLG